MRFALLFPIALFLLSTSSYAQQKAALPLLAYQQSIKLGAKVKPEDVYTAAESWFNANPSLFTSSNALAPSDVKQKNKEAVDKEFNNSHALQMLDPSIYKLQALGLIKYFGGTTTSIRMLYIKYDIAIAIKAGSATFSISNVRYFHFDAKNYNPTGIFSFDGGKPCEHSGNLDALYNCQTNAEEFKQLSDYFNKTVKAQAEAFNKGLKDKKMLYTAPATTSKSTSNKKSSGSTTKSSSSTTKAPAKK